MQLLIGKRLLISRLTFPDQRRLVSSRTAKMAIEAVLRNVQLTAYKPLGKGFLPFEDALPFFVPDE